MNPLLVSIPQGALRMIAIIRRIVAQGNHVIISSHDIDLIYEISDAVYVLRQGQILTHGAPGEVFACTEAMEHAGLTQPWLVKLHTQLGLPLCKTETEFFHRMQKCAFRGGVMTQAVMLQGDGIRRRQKCAGGGFMPHFLSGWSAYRAV
ncbi:cobalt transporter ATP-binding subunit [Salmonella enterica subsp. enterica]|nr:cobalt transporter ATP-binding subunit [Salmonella enterica subsp. enterica]